MSETKERPPLYPLLVCCLIAALFWLFVFAAFTLGQSQDPRTCGTVVPDCETFQETMSRVFRDADCLAPPDVAKTVDESPKWKTIGTKRRAALRGVREWASRCGYRPLEPSTARTERVIR
jgi:hypothetical protein